MWLCSNQSSTLICKWEHDQINYHLLYYYYFHWYRCGGKLAVLFTADHMWHHCCYILQQWGCSSGHQGQDLQAVPHLALHTLQSWPSPRLQQGPIHFNMSSGPGGQFLPWHSDHDEKLMFWAKEGWTRWSEYLMIKLMMIADFVVFSWKKRVHGHAVVGTRARYKGQTRWRSQIRAGNEVFLPGGLGGGKTKQKWTHY